MSLPCKFDHPGTARRPAAAVLAPVPVRGLRLGANLGRVPAMPLGLHRDDARLHVKGGREAGAARLRERGERTSARDYDESLCVTCVTLLPRVYLLGEWSHWQE